MQRQRVGRLGLIHFGVTTLHFISTSQLCSIFKFLAYPSSQPAATVRCRLYHDSVTQRYTKASHEALQHVTDIYCLTQNTRDIYSILLYDLSTIYPSISPVYLSHPLSKPINQHHHPIPTPNRSTKHPLSFSSNLSINLIISPVLSPAVIAPSSLTLTNPVSTLPG